MRARLRPTEGRRQDRSRNGGEIPQISEWLCWAITGHDTGDRELLLFARGLAECVREDPLRLAGEPDIKDVMLETLPAMVRRRAKAAGIATEVSCHTFHATGLTTHLQHPEVQFEIAQRLVSHSDPRTARLCDCRDGGVSFVEVERVGTRARQ